MKRGLILDIAHHLGGSLIHQNYFSWCLEAWCIRNEAEFALTDRCPRGESKDLALQIAYLVLQIAYLNAALLLPFPSFPKEQQDRVKRFKKKWGNADRQILFFNLENLSTETTKKSLFSFH